MNSQNIIIKTKGFVENKLKGEGSGHDWWHIVRVYNNALNIAKNEKNVDLTVVELASLLHDISDWKFNDGDHNVGSDIATTWLQGLKVDNDIIHHVAEIIRDISFRGAAELSPMKSLEGMIVQDADRLDAIGAIGIARTFAYGGFVKREMYNPEVLPEKHISFEHYKKSKGTTINHFYEKLLLLKNRMNTDTGKKLALLRHNFMENYLEEFYKEWNGLS